ncbi:uncharacterized, partial [Tachysurus ichikawai]
QTAQCESQCVSKSAAQGVCSIIWIVTRSSRVVALFSTDSSSDKSWELWQAAVTRVSSAL